VDAPEPVPAHAVNDAELPYPRIDAPPPDDADQSGIVSLVVVAAVAGAIAGFAGALFRLALVWADGIRADVLDWTRDAPAIRWLLPVVLAGACVALARFIVRFVPEAAGSGVQRVEANMREEQPFPALRIIPAKFVGGVLAIGAGMALGREGPTVQMGAAIGSAAGKWTGASEHDRRTLAASLAGAGLGVAFSAPLGGAMFVFEEVAHAFRARLVVATVTASATALAVAALMVGPGPIFPVPAVDAGPLWMLVPFALLGLLLGAGGVLYNRLVIAFLDLVERLPSVAPELKAGAIGAGVGLLGVAAPHLVGGGEGLTEVVLMGGLSAAGIAIAFLVRGLLGPFSYAAGVPGGLFAPLLVVGALAGSLLATVVNIVAPGLGLSVLAFGIVGMSTFFAATVRAPITGILLIVEMTATTSLLVPMLVAATAALVTASLLRGRPVYDLLRERLS
jgi:chloride channel protein, CIC family